MDESTQINRPIILSPDELRTKEILVIQRTYILDETQFNKLIHGPTGCKDWAQRVLFMSIGWAFKIVSALIVFLIAYSAAKPENEVSLDIKAWEIVSVLLALLVCLILFIMGHLIKNEKDKLIETIRSHFENHK